MTAIQGELFSRPEVVPDLTSYQVILASISGGKDSQSMLAVLAGQAQRAGVLDRVTCVFADLGEDEWPGTAEIAAEQAAHYGLRFITVCKTISDPVTGLSRPQSLLEYIEHRGRWPRAQQRYCTSDMKRGPIRTVMTRLVREQREAGITGRVRLLHVMGLRAQESAARRLLSPFSHDPASSNATRREVDLWLPVHSWTTDQVWEHIRQSGVRYHPAYDAGMPRLSCRFCVLASRSALIRAAQLDPAGARKRAALEQRMGHNFRQDLSMAQIIREAEAAPAAVATEDWAA
jgi:3'-phosphoadenosine 5'-phosphosulfate sulfotransferase (PAPS reductase)/FAD synthetase